MQVEYSIYTIKYDDKEKLVIALTNSGYIVSATRIYDSDKPVAWRIDIYDPNGENHEKQPIRFSGEEVV